MTNAQLTFRGTQGMGGVEIGAHRRCEKPGFSQTTRLVVDRGPFRPGRVNNGN